MTLPNSPESKDAYSPPVRFSPRLSASPASTEEQLDHCDQSCLIVSRADIQSVHMASHTGEICY